jgi:hypothetical protein
MDQRQCRPLPAGSFFVGGVYLSPHLLDGPLQGGEVDVIGPNQVSTMNLGREFFQNRAKPDSGHLRQPHRLILHRFLLIVLLESLGIDEHRQLILLRKEIEGILQGRIGVDGQLADDRLVELLAELAGPVCCFDRFSLGFPFRILLSPRTATGRQLPVPPACQHHRHQTAPCHRSKHSRNSFPRALPDTLTFELLESKTPKAAVSLAPFRVAMLGCAVGSALLLMAKGLSRPLG